GRQECQADCGDECSDEGADGGSGKRWTTASLTRHLVTFDCGHDGCSLTRRVQKNSSGGAAIHAAIVNTREHDQRARRIHAEGDRQKQGYCQGWPDAWQYADRSAEKDADGSKKQVHRRQCAAEAINEQAKYFHSRASE